MKITLSFSSMSPTEIAEARKFLDLLSQAPVTTTTFGQEHPLAPPAPPPPPAVGPPPPAPPPPAPPPPADASPASPAPMRSLSEINRANLEEAKDAAKEEAELDSAGYPWDERFHAKSKKKIKDGTWRRKKGVTQKDVEDALSKSEPAESPAGVVPPTPPLAPTPPAANGAANGEVSWEDVVTAFQARAAKYTQEQIQAALRSAVIEPTTLHGNRGQYAAAVAALDAQCPM